MRWPVMFQEDCHRKGFMLLIKSLKIVHYFFEEFRIQ
jgi:hypothetical protein